MAQGRGRGACLVLEAKCRIFLEALFICNNINTNLNKNFHTKLNYHSLPLFLFFQNEKLSFSWKNSCKEKLILLA